VSSRWPQRSRSCVNVPLDAAASAAGVAAASEATVSAAGSWHLDPSFGTDGFSVVAPEPGGDRWRWGRHVVVQPDGKIVVASATEASQVAVLRLLPDGARHNESRATAANGPGGPAQ